MGAIDPVTRDLALDWPEALYDTLKMADKIGRASCRERVLQVV